MTTEHEALRLADLLQDEAGVDGYVHDEAAAMLRKLVAEREEYRAAMRRALEALHSHHTEQISDPERHFARGVYDLAAIEAAISQIDQRLDGTAPSKNAVWVVRSYSKITNQRISESIDLDSYEKAAALRDQWEANPDFSVGMFAQVERIGE